MAFNDISNSRTSASARSQLQSTWGIVCPDDCLCRDKQLEEIIWKSKQLDQRILNLGSQGNPGAALIAVKKLMANQEIIHSGLISKARTLYDGFQIAIMKRSTMSQAHEFIRNACDIYASITSPSSASTVENEEYMKNPATHFNYLQYE